jgi:hypothetical protein
VAVEASGEASEVLELELVEAIFDAGAGLIEGRVAVLWLR